MSLDRTDLLPVVGVLGVEQGDVRLARAVIEATTRSEAASIDSGIRDSVRLVQPVRYEALMDGSTRLLQF